MKGVVKAVLLGLFLSASLMLHGCDSCNKEEVDKCISESTGDTCTKYQKNLDCYEDCCGKRDDKGKKYDDEAREVAVTGVLVCKGLKNPCNTSLEE
mmetsp:Transcript_114297/g.186313  ORF Transcript_114297/g.186313 Transcript_114297/m.186313 type:complete len:96 (-) Transcript_114297:72-359(-)